MNVQPPAVVCGLMRTRRSRNKHSSRVERLEPRFMLSSSCLQPIGTDSGPYLDLYPPSSGGDILQDASVYNRLNLAQSDFCDQQCTAFAYQAAESEELPPEKQAPVLDPIENKTVEEGSLLSFTVAATDPDPGQILTYELDPTAPAGASIDPVTGVFSWTPADGTDASSFDIKVIVRDDCTPALSDFKIFTVNVSNVAPTVDAGTGQTVLVGHSFSIDGSFVDPGADIWTATVDYGDSTGPQPLALNDKQFVLGHAYSRMGTYNVTVSISDGTTTSSDSLTMTVTLLPQDFSYRTSEDSPISVSSPGLLGNNAGGIVGSVTTAMDLNPGHGSVTVNPDGSFLYIPAPEYSGTDTFTYRLSDGVSWSNPARVFITIDSANDNPVATYDLKTATEDTPLQFPAADLVANDSDADGDVLTVSKVDPASHGTVRLADGVITYSPASNYYGPDSFVYWISDGKGSSDKAFVILTVNPVNDPPVAVADQYVITEDSAPQTLMVVMNDYAANIEPGEALTVTSVSQPAHGQASILADGAAIRYTPNRDFFGTDTLTYIVSDPGGATATATVTVSVTNVNDAPVASADTKLVRKNTALTFPVADLLANDTDPDGETPTIKAVGSAAHGTVTLSNATITYTPQADYLGPDSFTYTVTDAAGLTSTAQVAITVRELNHVPVAGADSLAAMEDAAVSFPAVTLLANDTDADGDLLSVVSVTTASETQGTVLLNNGQVTFTPAANFYGAADLLYTISDGQGGTATGIVTIAVQPVNDPPTLAPITGPLVVDEAKTITFTATASDVDGDPLTFSLVDAPVGTLIDPATGIFSWTPTHDQAGTYSFLIRVTDSATPALSDTKSVTITVNDVPIVNPILQVQSLTPTASGFDLQFNGPIDLTKLNLYDGVQSKGRATDLTIVGENTGAVTGSATWDVATNTLHFVKTGGVLPADNYTVTLFSRPDGFVGLDGDQDGTPIGDYIHSFTVAPTSAPIVSIPDIARGPKQSMDLPIRIDNAAGVYQLQMTLRYDPSLLTVRGIALSSGLPGDWQCEADLSTPGQAKITAHGLTPLSLGSKTILNATASVPSTADYGTAGILTLENVKVNDSPAIGDTAVQVVAYLGDTSGNQDYSGVDAAYIANVAVGVVKGFDAFPTIDPLLIGDITGDGRLGGLDASYVAQKSVGMVVPQIPDLPATPPAAQEPITLIKRPATIASLTRKSPESLFCQEAITSEILN